MRPLRIVLVMIEPPLPFGNAAARWFYVLLKGLVERGHNVTAFAACAKPGDIAAARDLFPSPAFDLRPYPIVPDRGFAGKWRTLRKPFSYMFSREFTRDLDATLAGGFDVLHLEQLWSGWLGLRHVEKALVNVHYLLEIDLALERPNRLGAWKDRVLGLVTERRMARAYPYAEARGRVEADQPAGRRDDRAVRDRLVPLPLHSRRAPRNRTHSQPHRLDELGAEPVGRRATSHETLARDQEASPRRSPPGRRLASSLGALRIP